MSKILTHAVCVSVLLAAFNTLAAGKAGHIVVIVWDGMRPDFISQEHTPTLAQLVRDGAMFQNHHSTYISATDVNGAAMATGNYPARSGIIANKAYLPHINPNKAVTVSAPEVIISGDRKSRGNFLLCPTLAETLQAAGKTTAIAGSKTVALLHDRRERGANAASSVVFEGKAYPPSLLATLTNQLGAFPGYSSDGKPNDARDEWTRRALTEVLWSNGVPVYSLLWLSEPDASQHATGPGSAQSIAAMQSSDRQLAAVLAELDRRKLRDQTDVFVVSDHGFSTIDKAVDVCAVLKAAGFRAQREFKSDAEKGDILVVGQSGSVLFYVMGRDAKVTRKLVEFLQQQEFAGVILTRNKMKGTFTLEQARVNSPAPPDVILSMRWSAEKSANGTAGLFYSDGGRKAGGGNHASLSRFDVRNTLVAAGPDFKGNFIGGLATGNTDLAPTILWLLGVKPKERMDGRVLTEALTAGTEAPPVVFTDKERLDTSCTNGATVWHQYLQTSTVNKTVYLDEGNGGVTAIE